MAVKKSECVLRLFYKYGLNISSFKALCSLFLSKKNIIKLNLKSYSHPFFLRKNSSDIDVFYEVMLVMAYNFETNFETKPEIIIDCGANIGLTSIFFKNKYPDSKIIAIEPERTNFELMIQNLAPYNSIICENTGVWSKNTYLKVDKQDATNWGFSFHEVEEHTENSIGALSIKSIMQKYSIDTIDILKIDIEGAEKELFITEYKYWMDRTRLLIIELHDRTIDGCSKALIDVLSQYNFLIEIRSDNIFCFLKH